MSKILFDVSQIWVLVVGLPTVYYVSRKSIVAPILGLVSAPAWIYSSVYSGQWGTAITNLAFAALWGLTAYRWSSARHKVVGLTMKSNVGVNS